MFLPAAGAIAPDAEKLTEILYMSGWRHGHMNTRVRNSNDFVLLSKAIRARGVTAETAGEKQNPRALGSSKPTHASPCPRSH